MASSITSGIATVTHVVVYFSQESSPSVTLSVSLLTPEGATVHCGTATSTQTDDNYIEVECTEAVEATQIIITSDTNDTIVPNLF